MTFKNITANNKNNNFMFSIVSSNKKSYHEFFLTKGDDEMQTLTEVPVPVNIKRNDEIKLSMRGFIPSPDTHYELIIRDANNIQYRIPIVFFKELSNISKYSLLVELGILFGLSLGILLGILLGIWGMLVGILVKYIKFPSKITFLAERK
jgi:hypothetical protein